MRIFLMSLVTQSLVCSLFFAGFDARAIVASCYSCYLWWFWCQSYCFQFPFSLILIITMPKAFFANCSSFNCDGFGANTSIVSCCFYWSWWCRCQDYCSIMNFAVCWWRQHKRTCFYLSFRYTWWFEHKNHWSQLLLTLYYLIVSMQINIGYDCHFRYLLMISMPKL